VSTTLINVRGLLTEEQLADVTATVQGNNPGMDQLTAERIVINALAFIAAAAANPTAAIAPSRTVDEGWHALILHTALYARLCERLGRFVHHYPERPDPARQTGDILDRTVMLIETIGHTPDPDLWTLPDRGRIPVAADCGHAPLCGPIEPRSPGGGDVAVLTA
jgi:hypothetical protein